MKPRLSKLDKIIIGFGTLLIALTIVYAQFLSLTPLKSDLGMKQQSLRTEQKLLDVVSQKKSETTKTEAEDTTELQKKIPVKPLQEQFLLDLEKAETVSNSKIKTMSFSKDADAIPATGQPGTENSGAAQGTTSNQNNTNPDAGANQAAPQQQATPTGGLKKLTVQLQVESPTYEDFEKFIDSIESLKRIVVVEIINYTGSPEVTSLEQEVPPFSYSLTVSAFYMPGLTDLEAQLPKMDAPAAANKENPLSQFPSTANSQP